jgi:hypothetical protein
MHIKNTLVQSIQVTLTVREDLGVSYDSEDIGISESLLKLFATTIVTRGMRGLKRDYSNVSIVYRISDVKSMISPIFDENIDGE